MLFLGAGLTAGLAIPGWIGDVMWHNRNLWSSDPLGPSLYAQCYMCATHSKMAHWHVTGRPRWGMVMSEQATHLALAYCGRRQARNRSIVKDFGS